MTVTTPTPAPAAKPTIPAVHTDPRPVQQPQTAKVPHVTTAGTHVAPTRTHDAIAADLKAAVANGLGNHVVTMQLMTEAAAALSSGPSVTAGASSASTPSVATYQARIARLEAELATIKSAAQAAG